VPAVSGGPKSDAPKSERAKRSGALVPLDASGALLPASCACCGAPPARSAVARAPDGAELIVPYCDECSVHLGRESTRRLAGVVASGLVGGGLAFALPFASEPLPLALLALVVLAASLVPILLFCLWPRTPAPGHSAVGPAARFVEQGTLACANDRFAAELSRANGTAHRRARFRERRFTPVLLLVPLLAAVAAAATLLVGTPVVRIVNLSIERLVIEIDGRPVAEVDPTSVEAPSAGVEVRAPAGSHEFVARTASGRVLERAAVTVRSRHAHLFAPASNGYCFWLETAEYGRERSGAVTREDLTGPPHFWALPADLGGWFRPVPDQALAEARLTGGVVTVLRQAPCGDGL
jgi:hypothetical protein